MGSVYSIPLANSPTPIKAKRRKQMHSKINHRVYLLFIPRVSTTFWRIFSSSSRIFSELVWSDWFWFFFISLAWSSSVKFAWGPAVISSSTGCACAPSPAVEFAALSKWECSTLLPPNTRWIYGEKKKKTKIVFANSNWINNSLVVVVVLSTEHRFCLRYFPPVHRHHLVWIHLRIPMVPKIFRFSFAIHWK